MTCPLGKLGDGVGGTDAPWIDTKVLASIRKNNRGISDVERLRTLFDRRSATTLKVSYLFMLETGICRGLMLIREDFLD